MPKLLCQLPALQEMMKSFYRCTESRFERFELYSFFRVRLCCHPFLGSQLAMMMCWVFGAFSIHPVTHSHEFDTHDTDVVKLGYEFPLFITFRGTHKTARRNIGTPRSIGFAHGKASDMVCTLLHFGFGDQPHLVESCNLSKPVG